MKSEEITREIKRRIELNLGLDMTVREEDVLKDNGIYKHCIVVSKAGSNVGCVFYEDIMTRMYNEGVGIEDICDMILNEVQAERFNEVSVEQYKQWEYCRNRVFPRIMNTKKNQEKLEGMPSKEFLDLSVCYYIQVENPNAEVKGIINIVDEMLEYWGIDEDELYITAVANMQEKNPPHFNDMISTLLDMLSEESVDDNMLDMVDSETREGMYVLTSRDKHFGAVYMMIPSVLTSISNIIGDEFIILPSSVNEVIILNNMDMDRDHLKNMVHEVNYTAVPDGDILSDSVYICSNQEVRIVA